MINQHGGRSIEPCTYEPNCALLSALSLQNSNLCHLGSTKDVSKVSVKSTMDWDMTRDQFFRNSHIKLGTILIETQIWGPNFTFTGKIERFHPHSMNQGGSRLYYICKYGSVKIAVSVQYEPTCLSEYLAFMPFWNYAGPKRALQLFASERVIKLLCHDSSLA